VHADIVSIPSFFKMFEKPSFSVPGLKITLLGDNSIIC
jgi:hypothetical protein